MTDDRKLLTASLHVTVYVPEMVKVTQQCVMIEYDRLKSPLQCFRLKRIVRIAVERGQVDSNYALYSISQYTNVYIIYNNIKHNKSQIAFCTLIRRHLVLVFTFQSLAFRAAMLYELLYEPLYWPKWQP